MADARIAPLDLIDLEALLTDEERLGRDTVRRFVDDRVRPHVARWYVDGRLPGRDLARELGDLGVLGMHREGYGGAGTSATAYGLACLELEAGDSGLRSLVSVQGSLAMFALHRHGSEEQRQEWLPRLARGEAIGCFGLTEPDSGSDPAGMRTTARRDGGDWVLSGSKAWITNGEVADVAIVWARTDDGVRGFVVPTDAAGFSAGPVAEKLSLRASVTSRLDLDDVRLPDAAALPGATGLGAALACLNEARFGIVFGVVGAARDCLETAVDYAVLREQFGRPLAGFQLTQRKVAGMTVEVCRAMLLALHLGRRKDAGALRPAQVSLGKLANARAALDVAREARTVLGANGISVEYPVMRHAANLESVLTYEGTEEVHTLVVGEAVTGISAYR